MVAICRPSESTGDIYYAAYYLAFFTISEIFNKVNTAFSGVFVPYQFRTHGFVGVRTRGAYVCKIFLMPVEIRNIYFYTNERSELCVMR